MNARIKRAGFALAGAALLALQGCSSYVSGGIAADGTASEVVFPDPAANTWLKEGTYPNLDNLRSVSAGMSKAQLYALIGPPHFNEGIPRVVEWDYLFNFRQAAGGVKTCQYKVIFDKDLLARSLLWKPAGCGDEVLLR